MKNNPRITKQDKNLIKGALRRVFARSELRNKIIALTIVPGHTNIERPRVKTWCKCPLCKEFQAKSSMVVDHIDPVVGLKETLYDLDANTLIDRLWCQENNLQPTCLKCHKQKTLEENRQRRKYKKGVKDE